MPRCRARAPYCNLNSAPSSLVAYLSWTRGPSTGHLVAGGTAWTKTERALSFLESENLAVDPVATATAMVLIGLVPVRLSVRTPKGERVHKEISISAASWSLDVKRGVDKGQPFTDFDFHFRGIQAVKSLLLNLASQFNSGQSQENGSIESRHDSLKTALDQALRLRGSRCFDERAAYEALVATSVARRANSSGSA
jgi:hypothetical protein